MSRIPDSHLRSVVYLYPTEEGARNGARVGGSGFVLFHASSVVGVMVRYVVTNRHVAEKCTWVRVNSKTGVHVVQVPSAWWFAAVADVAVAILPLPNGVAPDALTIEALGLSEDERTRLNIGPGDEVYMCGRFISTEAQERNLPTARFGNISQVPDPAAPVKDGRGILVQAYLVEMRSQSGFSGSPVFLRIPQYSFRGVIGDTSTETNTTLFRLLGLDTGHMVNLLPIIDSSTGLRVDEDWRAVANNGVALVAPIEEVTQLLDTLEVAAERDLVAESGLTIPDRDPRGGRDVGAGDARPALGRDLSADRREALAPHTQHPRPPEDGGIPSLH